MHKSFQILPPEKSAIRIPSVQTIMTLASFYGVEVSELLKTE